ncbi:carboxylating nicotinate-nucleotide diphosphorylase [Candidatus Woesearchaeota archaeon]|nr:carboxylating nicotinate-nucleotide diphosphorylase [Candidatus Woesearchaeota archaeon]
MDRKKALLKAFQRGHLLTLDNTMYRDWIEKFIIGETKGDIGSGDLTSKAVMRKNKKLKAAVVSRQSGIIAGLEEVILLYKRYRIKAIQKKKDGDRIRKGDRILDLEGEEKDLLKIERSALDLMQRMSGIATLTNKTIRAVKNKVQIAPTRKTQWRYLDKKSVFVGGGLTHRLALWESILIKDNHLKALKREGMKNPIEISLKRAWQHRKKANFIEIEVTEKEQAIKAATIFKKFSDIPCLIMLDNMPPKRIKATITRLKKLNLYSHVLLEASGGITPANEKKFARTGVDVISMGYLTHSSKALDIKQFIL